MSKKIKYIWALVILTLLTLLVACEEGIEFPAKEEHLKNVIFQSENNMDNSLSFFDDKLTIRVNSQKIKPFMDENDLVNAGTKSEWIIEKYKVKTSGDEYHITGEGVDIKLKRIGKRIIQDTEGERYSTDKDLN
ncbi:MULTISPECIES: hypothetical protein [unclassified Psychrobacillus]|uniref:hypothetical protein n=1 Tax=unclassified Psychrobacillus TaxID=2636677 RepID=UPI0030FA615B